ncbi:MAG: phospholipase [Deltaproteobacteria bacterium]|nr:phospholipase [Deltaproteobacteria bacterium]
MSDAEFSQALSHFGSALHATLSEFERIGRRLHPPAIDGLSAALRPAAESLDEALAAFRACSPATGLEGMAQHVIRVGEQAASACASFLDAAPGPQAFVGVIAAMQEHSRAVAEAYPLRRVLPVIDRYFLEPGFGEGDAELDPPRGSEGAVESSPRVGVLSANNAPDSRGGFSLYVPESYDPSEARPLVVALHGAYGHGADFLWTWQREARSRRLILMAPTSRGSTWSFNGPDVDAASLASMLKYVRENWRVDPERILLTGLSDGATYTLLHGLREESPYTVLAPMSGVLHPANLVNGNIERAEGRRIYLVHGALDWMFPVQVARVAVGLLGDAGADLRYQEVEDLSHTHAREENARVLDWSWGDLEYACAPRHRAGGVLDRA